MSGDTLCLLVRTLSVDGIEFKNNDKKFLIKKKRFNVICLVFGGKSKTDLSI